MKKQFSKRKLVSKFLMVPLLAVGIGFSVLNLNKLNEETNQGLETLSSDVRLDDSSYVDPDDVDYRVNKPNPMSFDADGLATFDFLVERSGGSTSWEGFVESLVEFDIVFEEANTLYGENILAKIEMDNSNFENYFSTSATNTAPTAVYTSKPLDLMAETGNVLQEDEEYQFRIYWEGTDVGRVGQYTEPVNFIYGVSAPVLSYKTYYGYEQAVIEADVLLYGALLDAYTDSPYLDTIYDKFQATWQDQTAQEIVNISNAADGATLIEDTRVIVDTENSENTIKIYFLFDDLKDGDDIGVDVNYVLSQDYGYLKGDSSYHVDFKSQQYELPVLNAIDSNEITVNDFDTISDIKDYGLYGGVTVPVIMTWTDKSFPAGWASIDTEFDAASFTPEVTFKKMVDSIKVESIRTTGLTGEEIDPSTVSLIDKTPEEDRNWNTDDPENIYKETDLYFDSLKLGESYEVNFKINLAKPEMFVGTPDYVTEKVTFETPSKIDAPKITISGVEVPTDETTGDQINDPTNWTELAVKFIVEKPATWTAAGVNNLIKPSDIFDSFEILAMEADVDEDGNVIYDPSTAIKEKITVSSILFDTESVAKITGLNSQHEYGIQVSGVVNETFTRIFGMDESDNVISSGIISSNTRKKSSLPSITLNTDLHDIYEPEETGETEYTIGFYIDSPLDGSWTFSKDEVNDASSAYFYKNIINNAYVTNVYSDADKTSSEAEALFNKKFYVNNSVPGNAGASTKVEDLYIDNATNDNTNANSITIDGLKTTWLYSGRLVFELTTQAVDATQGWLDTNSNSIKIDFSFAPGHPIKAPKVTVDSIDTIQTGYDRHSANAKGTIDISSIDVPASAVDGSGVQKTKRAYFEEDVLPSAQITSEIWIENEEGIYAQLSPQDWNSVIPTFADSYTEETPNYFDTASEQYHFEVNFDNLTGNTDYDLFISNSEDFGFIEDVTDATATFKTGYNEVLEAEDLSLYVTNFEFGNQNEATNLYENVQVNLNQVVATVIEDYPSYYGELSNNITSLEIVDTVNRNVVATFDPETISDLTVNLDEDGNPTGFGDISASLVNPLSPEQTVNLGEYSLVVGTDETVTASVPEIKLTNISTDPTFTTGGLALPEIKSINVASYKNAIKFDWSVSHMNNIDTAKLEIHHKSGLTTDAIEKVIDYDHDAFISTDDEDWVGHAELADPISGDDYYGVLTINPLRECEEDPAYVNTIESDTVTGAEVFDFELDITNVAATTDSIVLDYSWAKNKGTVISELKFEVVDLYAIPDETTGEVPIIYSEVFDISPESVGGAQNGSNSITIKNDNLIAGYELFSNQTYEIDGYYKKESEPLKFSSISEVMVDSNDMDLLTIATQPKGDAFVDSVLTSNESSEQLGYETTESSFAFSYNWDNRTTDNDINKNVTYNTLRVYSDGVISEDTLLWESDNLVDSIPGKTGKTDTFEVHNGDTQIGGKDTVDGKAIEVIPNANFVIVPYVEYDVYGQNSRDFETENRTSQKSVKIPFTVTEVSYNEGTTMFLDNDSVTVGYEFDNATAFMLNDRNYLEVFISDKDGQPKDIIFNGTLYDGTDGVKVYYEDITNWSLVTSGESDLATFDLVFDGLLTEYQDSITIASLVHIENADGSISESEDAIRITNESDQLESPFINAGHMGVIARKEVLDEYFDYEIKVESNFPINNFVDVVISEIDTPNTSATEIEVLDEAQVEAEFDYNENNLYIRVQQTIVEEGAAYNDLSFLVGRYIGVDASNMHGSGTKAVWDGYDWFAIDNFYWLYPPKTFWEILLIIIIWLLIILAVITTVGTIGGTGYYIFRITFSNKKWYPIVETIANEKFAVFTDYVENFGWTQKFQEYADLKDKNIKELREYALKMNIPITFDLNRKELLKTVSLLTDDEIEKFESFTDDDIDVKNYEILDHWKVARYKKYNFWIKYKLSKLEEKGILNANDDRLETIQAQIEYIEKEKAAHAEREQMFEEIKNLVADVLDTNVELTSEFSADPLNEFKKELEEKAAEEQARKEAEEAEIRAAVDAEEQARREAEEAEARAIAEKNEKEVKAIKTKLAFDYKKIVVSIASFNKGANKEVVGAEAAREVSEKLTLERNKINKLMDIFKQREERIVKLGGEPDAYAFETLNKVDIKVLLTPLEKFEEELSGMTKQALIDKAKKLKLEVKVSWSKDQLMKDMLEQVKERGDFND